MRNLLWRHIETLQAIASAGSLVQAAAALHLTPAALTARVKGLEEAVALKLFDRDFDRDAANQGGRGGARSLIWGRPGATRLRRRRGSDRQRGGRAAFDRRNVDRQIFRAAADCRLHRSRAEGRLCAFMIGNRDATIELLRNETVEIALSGRPPRDLLVERCPIGPHPLRANRAAGASPCGGEGLGALGSGGRTIPVSRDRLRDAVAVRRFHRRNDIRRVQMGFELGSNEINQTSGHGRDLGSRSHLGPHHRRGGRRRAARLPRCRRPADRQALVCAQPDRPHAVAGGARIPGIRRRASARGSCPWRRAWSRPS